MDNGQVDKWMRAGSKDDRALSWHVGQRVPKPFLRRAVKPSKPRMVRTRRQQACGIRDRKSKLAFGTHNTLHGMFRSYSPFQGLVDHQDRQTRLQSLLTLS